MNPIIYNISCTLGVALVSVGLGIERLSWGLASGGLLIIVLTIYGVEVTRRSSGESRHEDNG